MLPHRMYAILYSTLKHCLLVELHIMAVSFSCNYVNEGLNLTKILWFVANTQGCSNLRGVEVTWDVIC